MLLFCFLSGIGSTIFLFANQSINHRQPKCGLQSKRHSIQVKPLSEPTFELRFESLSSWYLPLVVLEKCLSYGQFCVTPLLPVFFNYYYFVMYAYVIAIKNISLCGFNLAE